MEDLAKAYIFSLVFGIISVALPSGNDFNYYSYSEKVSILSILIIIKLIVLLLQLFVAGHFIARDAVSRKKSKHHRFWLLLGVFGVILYHIFFARNKKKSKIK